MSEFTQKTQQLICLLDEIDRQVNVYSAIGSRELIELDDLCMAQVSEYPYLVDLPHFVMSSLSREFADDEVETARKNELSSWDTQKR